MGSHCGGLGWARDSRRPAPSHGGMVWLYLIVTLFACMSCILYREVASCCCAPFGRHWCGGAAWCRRLSGGDGGVDGGDNAAAEVTVVCARARAGERERTAVAGPWEVWGEPQCGATALLLLPLAASSSTSPQAVTSYVRTRTRRGATSRHARGDDDHDRDHDHDCNFDCDRRDRSEPERREMQRSYERRRWLRDGGGGGTGCSRRAACCCGDSVVHFSFSSSPAPALAKSSRPPLSPLQRLGKDGDEKARLLFSRRRKPPAKKKKRGSALIAETANGECRPRDIDTSRSMPRRRRQQR